jgi:CheY-like chemotaxis protein
VRRLNRTVLVVDDEALIADLWRLYAEMMGLEVCGWAATAADAVTLAEALRPAVVLMDMRLRGPGDGVDAALAIHRSVGFRVIFITASQERETLERIKLDHPAAVLIKPVSELLFTRTLTAALSASGPTGR